jgi:undecaprenyl-diphosphatase
MSLIVVVLLGIVQGLFMFLPVSSTAHLVLTQHFLIARGHEMPAPDSAEMILFDLVLHVGTLVSIVLIFRRSLFRFVYDLLQAAWQFAQRPAWGGMPVPLRLLLLGLLSVFVTGVMGLTLKSMFEQVFGTPAIVALTLSVTGVLLWWTDKLSPRWLGLKKIGVRHSLIVGAAQGLALMPGLSRSGMTIVAALLCGMKRRWAAEYSFFIAIPTILAATLVQGIEVALDTTPEMLGWDVYLVGFVTSAVVGTGALWLVLKLLYAARLRIFSFYLWALALLVIFGLVPMVGPH